MITLNRDFLWYLLENLVVAFAVAMIFAPFVASEGETVDMIFHFAGMFIFGVGYATQMRHKMTDVFEDSTNTSTDEGDTE